MHKDEYQKSRDRRHFQNRRNISVYKRMNYRSIFRNDKFSFGNLQVLSAAREYINNPHLLDSIWVYDDEFVKGLIHIEGHCVKELYVDCFLRARESEESFWNSQWKIMRLHIYGS